MELKFFSIDEVKEFVKQLKGTRGGKGDATDEGPITGATVPHPLNPPQGGAATFNPGGAFNPGAGFPTGPAPEVVALATRISARIDFVIQSMGQSPENTLKWFRDQFGPEAANATMDQIKTVFLPKSTVPALENIAKLIAA